MIRIFTLIIVVALLIIALPDLAATQPPGLPSDPSQAPIDGGLGILAALGGTYAIKKLRDRNRS